MGHTPSYPALGFYFLYTYLQVGMWMLLYGFFGGEGSQNTVWWTWFSPSTMWGPGMELRLSNLVMSIFTCWAISAVLADKPNNLIIPCPFLGHLQLCCWLSYNKHGKIYLILLNFYVTFKYVIRSCKSEASNTKEQQQQQQKGHVFKYQWGFLERKPGREQRKWPTLI